MSEQQENLTRVSSRIGAAILEFCTESREFRADELREFVSAKCSETKPCFACKGRGRVFIDGCVWECGHCNGDGVIAVGRVAPGSADRVLRDLRKRRKLNYKVLSRRESRYRVIPVEVTQATFEI